MPRRKTAKPKRFKRKRTYKKRRYGMFVPQAHLPLGQSQLVRHRYLENLGLNTNSGVATTYTFLLNSAYDPNHTGTGHQPLGYDQMAAIFQKYTVVGARVNVRVWNRDADEYVGFAIYFSEHASPLSSGIQGLLEQGALKYVILPPSTTGGGGRSHTFSAKVSMKKFFKVSNIMDSDDCRGTSTSNSVRPCFMHLIMWQPDGGLSNATGSAYVMIDQATVWSGPNTLGQS